MRDVARILRPRTFAVGFGAYFAVVAVASWTHASSLATPWFDVDLTRWVYASYLIASAAVLAFLGLLSVMLQSAFDRRVVEVNARLRELRSDPVVPRSLSVPAIPVDSSVPDGDRSEDAMAELVKLAEDLDPPAGAGADGTVVLEAPRSATVSQEEEQLVRRRESMKLRSEFTMRFLAGPAVASAAILSVAGAMLPGSDAFLQSYHQVNTALVLGFAYSWPGIGAYIVATFLSMAGSLRPQRKSVVS